MYTILLLCSFLTSFILYTRYKRRPPPGTHHAPGPAGLPVLGNAHQLGLQPHQQITAWAREYGELYKIRLGWNDWYMICSPEACKEILDKQSAHTSSRTPQPVAGDTLAGGMRFLFMPYGPEWRKLRGISHKLLTPNVSATFKPSQDYEAKMLLEEILKGRDEERGNEVGLMNDFSLVAKPGAYLADALPFFGKLPPSLQWWRKGLKPLFDKQANLWMSFWNVAQDANGDQFIETDYEKQGISELQAAFLAGSMIEAGSETTSAALNTAILYLSANPEARRKAQAELDKVVGSSRSPSFDDEQDLPYIRAIVKETLRMRPVTSIGTPHYSTAPVIYKNTYIPANSVVCLQQYPIHYDPNVFPEPDCFNPDRYLTYPLGSGHYAGGPASARDHWAFGAGRRICSGVHLAENSMFIVLAKLLWAFDILPPLDEAGREVRVDTSDAAFD
ncbi:hypothetical protein SNOG_04142 [Parastagonospora nodorum SN15]|uniref:Uncharacterized protein n=1 Tax=Phaeosphaeria nodorum (strain SN15 / ATCC MYA-4574 / FGSC 10173) TaxID=321614 RepID=Q0UVS2_PHANO|nr:hypothetical protein SNOG_04142 [Parastagonospora nodorum SN15]EAT87902.2 hypothetical protein SNOG_04142 [Parastagonospora nodorum SN15]